MKEALKLALEALENELAVDMSNYAEVGEAAEQMYEAIAAIKEALAQPEQKPFTYYDPVRDAIRPFPVDGDIALYTTPPQRQPEERNFCQRCGKRLASGFVEISIHTCTPPREKNT